MMFFKKKEDNIDRIRKEGRMMDVVEKKEIPVPRPMDVKARDENTADDMVSKKLDLIIHNQKVIYDLLAKKEQEEALTVEEKKYIPEDKVQQYIMMMQEDPETAKIMLEGYKARAKER